MRRNYVRRFICLPSRVTHSFVWILPDCHAIVALLVISGKQPSSELLHTLRFICVCWPPKRQCSMTSFPQHGSTSCLPGNFLARVTISTNVDDTASSHRARVSHNIHNRLEPRLRVSGGLRRLRFLLSSSAVESTHIFSAGSYYCRSQLSAGGHTESTRFACWARTDHLGSRLHFRYATVCVKHSGA